MNTFFDFINSGFQTVAPFIILLGILIFIHELGHFMVARWCGVRVEVFSLGFGKKILQKKVGDTVYALSLVPLGGYVKMFGDEIGKEISSEEQKVSFLHKNVWQRIAIVLAGPLMNLFFAFFLFVLIAFKGEMRRSAELGDIDSQSVAYQAGLRSGDFIISAQGQMVQSWDEFQNLLNQAKGQTLSVELRRMGMSDIQTVTLRPEVRPNPNPLALDSEMGFVEGLTNEAQAPILGVRPRSLAQKMGFKLGDEVKKINGFEIKYFRDIEPKLIALQGQDVTFDIERITAELPAGEKLSISIKLPSPLPSLASLGIEASELYLQMIVKNSPAEQAGLLPQDRIKALNNKIPTKWEDIFNTIKSHQSAEPLVFKVEREKGDFELTILPQESEQLTQHGQSEKRKMVGISPYLKYAMPGTVTVNYGLLDSLERGIHRSYEVSVMTVLSFVRLIQNKISPKTIGGVISIGQAASQTFKMGMQQFFTMMAIISINLFVLNLLPVPVLDGGHLLFYTIEAIKGAPVSMRKMEIAQQVGLFLLLSLMIFALFNDFSRLLGL